jgi:hypothetical protein
MDTTAITVKGLSKKYTLYPHSTHRLLDFFGFRPGMLHRQSNEYWALRDLTFGVMKGSTVESSDGMARARARC